MRYPIGTFMVYPVHVVDRCEPMTGHNDTERLDNPDELNEGDVISVYSTLNVTDGDPQEDGDVEVKQVEIESITEGFGGTKNYESAGGTRVERPLIHVMEGKAALYRHK